MRVARIWCPGGGQVIFVVAVPRDGGLVHGRPIPRPPAARR